MTRARRVFKESHRYLAASKVATSSKTPQSSTGNLISLIAMSRNSTTIRASTQVFKENYCPNLSLHLPISLCCLKKSKKAQPSRAVSLRSKRNQRTKIPAREESRARRKRRESMKIQMLTMMSKNRKEKWERRNRLEAT